MNRRISTILIVALLVSAGMTYLLYRLVASRMSQGSAPPTAQVVRAARTLEIGTLIHDADLKTGAWVGAVPTGMATKKDALVGRGVISTIYEGETVVENRLAVAGAGGGLAATIPPGMRACAVRVNDIVGLAGFVVPGMRVDVLIAGVVPGSPNPNGPQVKTLLQNIEVLSAGQNYQKDNEGKPVVVQVVNLLVTPEQAETLSLASNETRIQLVLRNPLDTQAAKVPGTAMASLFGAPPKPAGVTAPRPRPAVVGVKKAPASPERIIALPPYQIEIFNGSQRSEAKFDRSPEGKQ
jgi:pilus assembly protein CpaB